MEAPSIPPSHCDRNVNHNELVVYSCPCDTQKVSEMQQVHERAPTNPTAYM